MSRARAPTALGRLIARAARPAARAQAPVAASVVEVPAAQAPFAAAWHSLPEPAAPDPASRRAPAHARKPVARVAPAAGRREAASGQPVPAAPAPPTGAPRPAERAEEARAPASPEPTPAFAAPARRRALDARASRAALQSREKPRSDGAAFSVAAPGAVDPSGPRTDAGFEPLTARHRLAPSAPHVTPSGIEARVSRAAPSHAGAELRPVAPSAANESPPPRGAAPVRLSPVHPGEPTRASTPARDAIAVRAPRPDPPPVVIDQIQVITPPAPPAEADPFASLEARRRGLARHAGGVG